MIEIKKGNKTVSKSQNLRGILRYARKEPVIRVVIFKRHDGRAIVGFWFYDDAKSTTRWASESVAHSWLRSRRAWGNPVEVVTRGLVTRYDYLD